MFGAETKLRELCPRFVHVEAGRALERLRERLVAVERGARLIELADDHSRADVRASFVDRMRSMDSLTFVREYVRYQGGSAAAD